MTALDVEQLYREHGAHMLHFLLKQTNGNAERARDLSQALWLLVWEKADRYEDRGLPVTAWLYRVARNLLIDDVRLWKRTSAFDFPLTAENEKSNVVPAPVRDLDDQLQVASLLETLTAEQPLQARVLVCRFLLGMSIRETAAEIGNTVEGVKKLQARGLERCRRIAAGDLTRFHGSDRDPRRRTMTLVCGFCQQTKTYVYHGHEMEFCSQPCASRAQAARLRLARLAETHAASALTA